MSQTCVRRYQHHKKKSEIFLMPKSKIEDESGKKGFEAGELQTTVKYARWFGRRDSPETHGLLHHPVSPRFHLTSLCLTRPVPRKQYHAPNNLLGAISTSLLSITWGVLPIAVECFASITTDVFFMVGSLKFR